ncbi:hypothetical protein VMCG_02276 [Cytospora schulzeri]|uniref:Xylanolytic transcriptional activator regulatory domain-containing protein n=1 Tax=Cytospora schulzeri TaxID=448051 RepID=A0A423X1S4_9PEZI|nr:hypothetical protein VMCG_02276 [Valsa malicola]
MFLRATFILLDSMGYPKGRTILSNIFSNMLAFTTDILPEAAHRETTGNIHMAGGRPVSMALYGAGYHGHATNAISFVPKSGLGCDYQRERKKRGKASRKDLAQQAAAQAAVSATDPKFAITRSESDQTSEQLEPEIKGFTNGYGKIEGQADGEDGLRRSERLGSMNSDAGMARQQTQMAGHPSVMEQHHLECESAFDPNTYSNIHHHYDQQAMGMMNSTPHPTYSPSQCDMTAYPDISYSLQGQTTTDFTSDPPTFRTTTSLLSTYSIPEDGPSPGWMDIPSPSQTYQAHRHLPNHHSSQPRYPVLEPLVPHLENIIPLSLACDLIDLYFSSSSSAQMQPMSPYILGFVFRKPSLLHPSQPRRCQPALLASMLWVAAQTSDAPFLTSIPSARGTICQKLLELTVGLLNPLIHISSGDDSPVSSPRATAGVALGGLGVASPGTISIEDLASETGPLGAAGSLDDVITYIHLATVVSASEYKGASLRWWNAAWSLARELRLGRELPRIMSARGQGNEGLEDQPDVPRITTEEEREERRRTWWLVYIVDRHLALCYNRPLFLLDIECDGLLQPMDDTAFQNGDFQAQGSLTDPTIPASGHPTLQSQGRTRGPSFGCSGHSIYGYFLPLMTILGEIVELKHARNHPRFGIGFRSAREWDGQAMEIERHLRLYEQSLKRFTQRNVSADTQHNSDDEEDSYNDELGLTDAGTPSVQSVHSALTSTSRMTESEIQTRIVVAYGTHVMHVLHILLTGRWDPVNLLDDNDLWISSQAFITAAGHAVSAAEAVSHILEYDPGLEFMPFFFGIYLLQGSFLLLLIAEKLQSEASQSVVKACETIIRAHEACVVTLNTEYQRNFSRVMRSALAQIRGRVPEDLGEQHQRRRELLALYRWTGDGTGLAL